jgi:hypothetical protein
MFYIHVREYRIVVVTISLLTRNVNTRLAQKGPNSVDKGSEDDVSIRAVPLQLIPDTASPHRIASSSRGQENAYM